MWILRNASAYKIPGTSNYQDVTLLPGKLDIKAGASWLHLTDKWWVSVCIEVLIHMFENPSHGLLQNAVCYIGAAPVVIGWTSMRNVLARVTLDNFAWHMNMLL
jgi:hypothetical protein